MLRHLTCLSLNVYLCTHPRSSSANAPCCDVGPAIHVQQRVFPHVHKMRGSAIEDGDERIDEPKHGATNRWSVCLLSLSLSACLLHFRKRSPAQTHLPQYGFGARLNEPEGAKRTDNVDENAAHMLGISDGATGVYFFAFRDPTPWASFLPFIGHPAVLANKSLGVDGEIYPRNVLDRPFFVVNGGLDRL